MLLRKRKGKRGKGLARRRQREGKEKNEHWVGVETETADDVLQVPVHVRVVQNLVLEQGKLICRRKVAVEEEERRFEESRGLSELLDRVTAVAEDTAFAVDVGDAGLDDGGVGVARIVHPDPACRRRKRSGKSEENAEKAATANPSLPQVPHTLKSSLCVLMDRKNMKEKCNAPSTSSSSLSPAA
jgi:hypothetical protein